MNKIVICDVDGTLYDQRKLRVCMAYRLFAFVVAHPSRWSELKQIYYFRKVRELSEFSILNEVKRLQVAAERAGCDSGTMKNTIDYWMFRCPLDLIKKYRYHSVLDYLLKKREQGYKIAIYSDYYAMEKLDALGVKTDYVFYPSQDSVEELKPSRRMMEYILKKTDADVNDAIFIGDREDKDGASARLVGIDFIDVKELI